jgi:hypothetical protein
MTYKEKFGETTIEENQQRRKIMTAPSYMKIDHWTNSKPLADYSHLKFPPAPIHLQAPENKAASAASSRSQLSDQ